MTTQQNLKKVGKIVKYTSAKTDDKLIKDVSKKLFDYIEEEYLMSLPEGFSFEYTDIIDSGFISDIWHLNGASIECMNHINSLKTTNGNNTQFKPDGGFIFLKQVDENNNTVNFFPVICSEMKKQGTNPNQAKGNAFERINSSINMFNNVCRFSHISPYIAFCHGIDFIDQSILSRLKGASNIKNFDKINFIKNNDFNAISIFTKEEPFTQEELYNNCKNLVDKVMNYYINNNFNKPITKNNTSFIKSFLNKIGFSVVN